MPDSHVVTGIGQSADSHIVRSLTAWLNIDEAAAHRAWASWSSDGGKDLLASLRFSHTGKERLTRRLFTDVLGGLPYPLYRLITDILKRLRGRSGVHRRICFSPGQYMELATIAAKHEGEHPRPVRVCLTHDIDTQECAMFWPQVVRTEDESGVRSTSNVLTAGPYRLDRGWLDDLEARGFEVGLHGDTHDMAIGFRDMRSVRDRLRRCLDALGHPVMGYRAPALAFSEPLLAVLDELGFRYDSSIKANVYYTGGIDLCIPYLYPGTKMWEFPLVLQDDGLFRDQALDEAEALQVVQDVVDALRPYGGLVVFNSHPIHLRPRLSFYRRLLVWFADARIEVVLARDLVKALDETGCCKHNDTLTHSPIMGSSEPHKQSSYLGV